MKILSFEIYPCENLINIEKIIKYFNFKKINFLTITSNKIDNYSFIKKIKNIKINIVPHLICDNFKNIIKKIFNFLNIKIFNFLIITGDNCKKNSFFYIKKIRFLFGHIIKIFSGSYLEKHKYSKNIKKEILYNIKKNKIGINMYFTQFFYNFNIIIIYINTIRKSGINKNFSYGIFPKKKILEILNFSNNCKVNIDNWVLKNYRLINIEKIFLNYFKKMKNIHYYTFNNINFIKNYFK